MCQAPMCFKSLSKRFCSFKTFYFIFIWKIYAEKKWHRMRSSFCCFIPHIVPMARAESMWCQEQGMSSELPSWIQRPQHWRHPPLFSQAKSTELDQKWRIQDTKRCPYDAGCFAWRLKLCLLCHGASIKVFNFNSFVKNLWITILRYTYQ